MNEGLSLTVGLLLDPIALFDIVLDTGGLLCIFEKLVVVCVPSIEVAVVILVCFGVDNIVVLAVLAVILGFILFMLDTLFTVGVTVDVTGGVFFTTLLTILVDVIGLLLGGGAVIFGFITPPATLDKPWDVVIEGVIVRTAGELEEAFEDVVTTTGDTA